jgi:Uma2 family endonuclease
MTTEEMLALPKNGMDRELIRGRLREKPLTIRDRWHSVSEARIAKLPDNWLDAQREPRGEIVSGDAGFRLCRGPDESSVGIDVPYASAELVARTPGSVAFSEGVPVLAVEILSPSDKQEEVDEKVKLFLELGVALVWVVNPRFRTVCVYRPDAEPKLYNVRDELTAEPHLPGFRMPVAQMFS